MGELVRNVSVIYIDVSGVGRRALLRKAGKGIVSSSKRQGEDGRMETVQQEVVFEYGGNAHLTAAPSPPSTLPQGGYMMPPPSPCHVPDYGTAGSDTLSGYPK